MSGLSRPSRLSKKQDIRFVFECPLRKKTMGSFTLLCRKNHLLFGRLGIIIGKRQIKRAVDRNRMKRLIRASFESNQELLKGLDIVVLIRSECSPLDKQALREVLDGLWPKMVR